MEMPVLLALILALVSPAAAAAPAEQVVATDAAPRLMLNEATAEELAAIDGIGDADAAAIVELRTSRGRLGSVEELRVLPLSDAALSNLRSRAAISVTVGAPSPVDASMATAGDVLARFNGEPTVRQVQQWAANYANINPERVQRWLTQSATFATLPQLQLEFRLRNDFDQGFDYFDEVGLDPRDPQGDYFPVIQDADQGQTQEFKVRLVFDLDKLVMSSERIRVINEAQDIVKLRDQVLGEVTRLYFERRRLQAERLLAPKSDPLALVKEELRLMELTANIDALTGGAFSAGVSRGSAAAP
jgi:hypothetical protein